MTTLTKVDRRKEIRCLEATITEQAKEIDALKTVPMKYRRMAFNVQLQEEAEELRQQLAAMKAELEKAYEIGVLAKHRLSKSHALVVMLQEALHSQNFWVEGALNCREWEWDGDQREAAESCLAFSKEALSLLIDDTFSRKEL